MKDYVHLSKSRILSYGDFVADHDRLVESCGKGALPLQSENYSNSRVLGYGRLGSTSPSR